MLRTNIQQVHTKKEGAVMPSKKNKKKAKEEAAEA